MPLVKYTQNADPRKVTAVVRLGKDRPTLEIGGYAEVTDAEVAKLSSYGVVLEVVQDGLDDKNLTELKKDAELLGVDSSGLAKEDLVTTLRDTIVVDPTKLDQLSGTDPVATSTPATNTKPATS